MDGLGLQNLLGWLASLAERPGWTAWDTDSHPWAVTDPVDEVGVEEEKNLSYSSRAPVRKDRLAREKQTGIS